MMKPDKTIIKGVCAMAAGQFIGSVLVVMAFVILKRFTLPVLWGAMLGWAGAMAYYVMIVLDVLAATKNVDNVAGAKLRIQSTFFVRMLLIAAVIVLGMKVEYFHYIPVIIPFLLVRPVASAASFIVKE